MNTKTKNIIGWVLTGLLAFAFIASAIMKLTGAEEALKGGAVWGISADTLKMLGVIEIIAILLFIYPRTGLLGLLLVTGYMGGAIATHLQHQLPIAAPIILLSVVWITATIRFAELSTRLMGKPPVI